ncbi:MAG: lipopolysaccharide heptosyltransferase II [Pyrinomonadaceae bacterium]
MSEIRAIKRVVVRGTSWVGDSVMIIPALRALRKLLPEASITLAVRESVKDLFAEAEFIDELFVYDEGDSVFKQSREWHKAQFDLAILFQNAFRAALIPFLASVPLRFGFATERRSFLLTNPVALPHWRSSRHEVFFYLYLIAALEHSLFGTNTVCDAEPDIRLELSLNDRNAGLALLSSNGANTEGPLVAICPGSTNSRAKRWSAAAYANLADKLIATGKTTVVLIGAPSELDVTSEVIDHMIEKPVVLTGKTSVKNITAVLDAAELLVTNDTGPAHIAAALGTPSVVIFGPTNPSTTRPFSSLAEIIHHPPECAPCMLRDCPIDHRCMTVITVDEVFDRAQAILSKSRFDAAVRAICDIA